MVMSSLARDCQPIRAWEMSGASRIWGELPDSREPHHGDCHGVEESM